MHWRSVLMTHLEEELYLREMGIWIDSATDRINGGKI